MPNRQRGPPIPLCSKGSGATCATISGSGATHRIIARLEVESGWRSYLGAKLFATANALRSSVSRAIFWASMTSPATR
jgi:hypothetical protein